MSSPEEIILFPYCVLGDHFRQMVPDQKGYFVCSTA